MVMCALSNSSETNRLLPDARHDATAWETLFARHRERLQRMVRLRLDRRVPARFTSSAVLEDIARTARTRLHEYQAGPERLFFLWLRRGAGARIERIHQPCLRGARRA